MTANERIVHAAWAAVFGKLKGMPSRPGWCLQAVRVIIEAALFDGRPHALYAASLVAGTTRRPGDAAERLSAARMDPWAADWEASVKQLGWPVPASDRQAGDIVFNHNAAQPYGHVGILLTRDVVLENIDPRYRAASVEVGRNYLSLTPYASGTWTLVARVPQNLT